MKLFHYDSKHQIINDEINLGPITPSEMSLLNKVFAWLEEQGITDGRYKNLILAETYVTHFDDDDEPEIEFYF